MDKLTQILLISSLAGLLSACSSDDNKTAGSGAEGDTRTREEVLAQDYVSINQNSVVRQLEPGDVVQFKHDLKFDPKNYGIVGMSYYKGTNIDYEDVVRYEINHRRPRICGFVIKNDKLPKKKWVIGPKQVLDLTITEVDTTSGLVKLKTNSEFITQITTYTYMSIEELEECFGYAVDFKQKK